MCKVKRMKWIVNRFIFSSKFIVCQNRYKWLAVVSAYPDGEKAWYMYVCKWPAYTFSLDATVSNLSIPGTIVISITPKLYLFWVSEQRIWYCLLFLYLLNRIKVIVTRQGKALYCLLSRSVLFHRNQSIRLYRAIVRHRPISEIDAVGLQHLSMA